MDWHEATQRQVGAPGIGEVRQLLVDARDGAARERRERSLVITALTALVMVAVLVVGLPSPSVAGPLPPGTYVAATPGGDVSVTVAVDGEVDVEAPPALVVELDVDEDGRALSTFTVSQGATTWDVSLDVARDGTYEVDVVREDGDGVGPALVPAPDAVPGAGVGTLDDPVPGRGIEGPDTADEPSPPADAPDDAQAPDPTGRPAAPPGQTDRAPGRSGDAPVRTGDAPGGSGDAPGGSGDAPGGSGDAPGGSGDAPGGSGDAPGGSGDAPGQAPDRPGRPETPPGQEQAGAPGARVTD